MRDLHNNIKPLRGLSPVSVADNTAQVSQICDTKGFDSSEFVIITGSLADADATFTVLVEDGDAANLSDAAAVDDKYLLGTEVLAGFTFAHDDSVRRIGYNGNKRYWRVTITPANNASAALLGGVFINGHPRVAPTANP